MIEHVNDVELVTRLKSGDIASFDTLFERYAEKLYAFALKYLKSADESDEVVQEVFVKVWEKRHELKTSSSFKSFIFTIAYNDILKYFRRKAYHQSMIKDQMLQSSCCSNESERIEYRSVLEEVEKLISRLPERRKIIFLKSRIDGLSSKEIANQLNLSPGTVDNNISEALKFLRLKIKNLPLGVALFIHLFLL